MGFIKDKIEFISLIFQRRNFKEIIKKNIEIIYGYPLYLISFIIPRNKNKWVIGSHIGFSGNSKFLFIDLLDKYDKRICYWISPNKIELIHLKNLGLPAFYKWSFKGLYHCLTAKTYIFCFHLIDINFWTSGNVKRVNIWHGVGIKNIEFKSTKGSAGSIYNEKNLLSRIYLPYLFKRPHLFLSTSTLMTNHFTQCFRITPEQCVEDIYPRCKIFNWSKNEILDFVTKYEGVNSRVLIDKLSQYKKSYLYMPTWRETRKNFIEEAGFDFRQLNDVLVDIDAVFLLKLHPECNLDVKTIGDFKNIIILDKRIDIYTVLPFIDVLITDYSSIYYDFLLLNNKDILLFPFDYEEYISAGRDLAFDYNVYTPGNKAYTIEELMDYIKNDISLDFKEKKWIKDQFWKSTSHRCDLYKEICNLN